MTVFEIISEPLVIHKIGTAESRAEMVKELMRLVGLDIRHLRRYPHSFSGGQRQRIGIARALALRPDMLICDEPVSALDVSIQAQILNLLKDLRDQLGLTYLFISHNLAVVDYIADRIAVMCRGRLVELAPKALLFKNPVHPYTQTLVAAVPEPNLDRPLNLEKLMEGRANKPEEWPAPFTINDTLQPRLMHLGEGHYVRADPNAGLLPKENSLTTAAGGTVRMLRYLVHRLLTMIPTLLIISFIVFTIIQLPPGDYLETYIAELQAQGESIDGERIQFLREEYGLDRPFIVQYGSWVWGMLHGDLGWSFEHALPVTTVIGDRLWLTIFVTFATLAFVYIVSFPIGIYTAVRQYSIGDYAASFVGYVGLATPDFLLALVLLLVANRVFGTSIGGLMDPIYENQPWTWAKLVNIFEHMWIPVVVIGTAGTAAMIRRLRANLLDELNKQYVTTARAKGVPPSKILFKYPLRLAINPFISEIGNLLPQLISGSALVSIVLDLGTTGQLLLNALRSQDMYLAGSFLMFQSLLVVFGVLISDVLLALIDPRIRLAGGATK